MSASGTVVVQALIGKDGRVADTRVLKSIPALDDAAEDAVRRWRFKPAQADGVPVETWVSVPIQFRR
jgi:protein TonB